MMGERTGHCIHIWRLSDLGLLQTIVLPPGPRGDENENPSEVRTLEDGNSVIVGTFKCAVYLVENVATEPAVTFLRSFPWAPVGDDDTDCNLPVRIGKFWVQTVGTTGSLVVMDLQDLHKPAIVSEFFFGVDARPHWISLEPDGNRIVLTGGGTLRGGVVLLRIDPASGQLGLVESFRSADHPIGISAAADGRSPRLYSRHCTNLVCPEEYQATVRLGGRNFAGGHRVAAEFGSSWISTRFRCVRLRLP